MKRVIITGYDALFGYIEEIQESLARLGAHVEIAYASSPGALQNLIDQQKSEGVKPDIVAVPLGYQEIYIS